MNDFKNILAQTFALGLGLVTERNPALSAFTFAPDLQGQKAVWLGSVRIRVPVLKDAADFDPAVGFTGQATTYEKFDVTINKSKVVEFEINLGESASDADIQQVVSESGEVLATSIGQAISKELLAAAGDDTYFPYQLPVAAASGGYEDLVGLSVAMDNAKAFGARTTVVNPSLYGELLLDDRVIASNTNSGSNATQTGVLTNIAGQDVAKATSLPAGLRGFATNKTGLAFVPLIPIDMQTVFNLPKVAETGVYTDAASGISMYWQAWFDPSKVKARVAALLFFGIGKCRPEGLIRIVGTGEANLPEEAEA